ncbi:hypothetical protein MWU60_11115 [Yoonia sp. F2084L]|uniref:hypothetical protein n=1 Tax=Yoonia sp. F2084L TaxID=2926419 RepID=UPI001FF2AAA0|nr:hypothetical protein [Yoonia sp. F2084L]MCK0096121.1 hypothetical protein [Yoonia sp. F2084L]
MRFSILSVLVLSACTSIVPLTAMRLSTLSPITADPADFAVDLTLPAGIDVSPEGAKLLFTVTRADRDETQEGAFALRREGSVFTVDPDDHAALRVLQATAREWRAENGSETSGSIMINVSPCRLDAGPSADARVSVAIRMEQGGVFMPLVRNGPLSAVTSQDQLRDMPGCP